MNKAVAAVDSGIIPSVRRAALAYGLPRSTLQDHVDGKVKPDAKPGPTPYLSSEEEEEDELVNFLIKCSRIGYAKTRLQMLGIVQE